MGMREKLIKILRAPIYTNELTDPVEAVADYLLDNNVVPVVRCRDCKKEWCYLRQELGADGYCSAGERKGNG